MTGEEIKKLRLASDLSQEEFGAEIGVSATAVCLWERGRHGVGYKSLSRVEDV